MNNRLTKQEVQDLLLWLNHRHALVTVPDILIELTGDLRSAVFLARCMELAATSDNFTFARPAKDWEDELKISTYVVGEMRKKLARWITTETHHSNNIPVTHYTVNFKQLYTDLLGIDQQDDEPNGKIESLF